MPGMARRFLTWVSMLVGASAVACASTAQEGGSLKVKMLDAATDRPSNVALHLAVGGKNGEPIAGLKPTNFRIFEDGKLVPEDKAKRMLLDPRAAEVHVTVLLIDLSGPIVETPSFPELIKQTGEFIERLQSTHQLTVSLFDGRDDVRTVLEPDESDVEKALSRIRHYRPEERKGNLNGAVLRGLAMIDKQLAASKAGHKVANLVVFTDRGDMAQKVPEEDLEVALDKTPADVYLIGVGPGIKRPELGKVARTDAFYSTQLGDLQVGFEHLGKHLEVGAAGQYLLSYCSPKRKGQHALEIEVVTEKEHGKFTHKFSADGFVKGCSPKNLPAFVASKHDKGEDNSDDKSEDTADRRPVEKPQRVAAKKKSEEEDGEKAPAAPTTESDAAEESGAVPAAVRGKSRGKAQKLESKADKEE